MAQFAVHLVATDDLDYSITISVNGKRIEYLLGYRYQRLKYEVAVAIRNGWNNQAVAIVTEAAREIYVEGKRQKKEVKMSITSGIETSKIPSKDFPFTIIAVEAKSLHYNHERVWLKTEDDAKKVCQRIFSDIPKDKPKFQLAIVQWEQLVEPEATEIPLSVTSRT